MTPDELAAIEALAEGATAGPWGWRGYVDGSIELRALHSGGLRIVSTARAEPCTVITDDGSWCLTEFACEGCRAEMSKPMDPFLDYRCAKPENLDTVWLWHESGAIRPSNEWAVREVPYRGDVVRVDHPDAAFIAAARTAVPALVAEVRRLTIERDQNQTMVAEVLRDRIADADKFHGEVLDVRGALLAAAGEIERLTIERDRARDHAAGLLEGSGGD